MAAGDEPQFAALTSREMPWVAPICQTVINLGGPLTDIMVLYLDVRGPLQAWGPLRHLSPSFNPPFFPSLSWTLQGVWSLQSPLTRCQTFWCSLYSQTAL